MRVLDELTLYANKRLEKVDEDRLVLEREGCVRQLHAWLQAEVLGELWLNLDVVDDFVRENPAQLSAGELDSVRSELMPALDELIEELDWAGEQWGESPIDFMRRAEGVHIGGELPSGYEPDDVDYDQHEGALAGMSPDERKRAIEDYMASGDAFDVELVSGLLDEQCIEGPVTRSLPELLAMGDPEMLHRFAHFVGCENVHGVSLKALAADVAGRVDDASYFAALMSTMTSYDIDALHELASRGGLWSMKRSSVVQLRGLPRSTVALAYVFSEGGAFTFVMPDETLALLRDFDWHALRAMVGRRDELIGFVDKVVDLRGIIAMDEAIEEYRQTFPDGYAETDEIEQVIREAMLSDVAECEVLEVPDGTCYVMHYELMFAYEDSMGIEHNIWERRPLVEGELAAEVERMLESHGAFEPRPLTQSMLEAQNLVEWRCARPAAQAFTAYLDCNVPNMRDDYFFADKVVEELLSACMWGIGENETGVLFDVLENNDFVARPDQVQDLLDLWVDLRDEQPTWLCNGWAPGEAEDGRQQRASADR